jgi:hypothetical protein
MERLDVGNGEFFAPDNHGSGGLGESGEAGDFNDFEVKHWPTWGELLSDDAITALEYFIHFEKFEPGCKFRLSNQQNSGVKISSW